MDAQGRPTAGRRGEIRRMDTARVQDRAVEALEAWEAQGVIRTESDFIVRLISSPCRPTVYSKE